MKVLKFFFALFFFCTFDLEAACTSPTGVKGQFQFVSPDFFYCDDSSWQSLNVSVTGTSCTTAGKIEHAGSEIFYCNGSVLVKMNSTESDGACTQAGSITLDSPNNRLEWCNGSTTYVLGPFTPPAHPCAGKAIGQACYGTTALYGMTYLGYKYMVPPGGSDPNLLWGTNASLPPTSTTDGEANSIMLDGQTDAFPAAEYCINLSYGGFDDWYLAASEEMNALAANRLALGFNLPDFYWTSSASGTRAWAAEVTSMSSYLLSRNKNSNARVRCVRKYLP